MARVGGSYESVVRGVSEQAPQDRRSGQMWEQVNMISDPVRGLTRRHGSEFLNNIHIGPKADNSQLVTAATQFSNHPYYCNGRELEIIYSKYPIKNNVGTLNNIHCYDKTGNKFLHINGRGPVWDTIQANGVSSLVNIGKFMFIAAKGYTGDWTTVDKATPAAQAKDGCVWIRNGDFSRTYTFRFTRIDGTEGVATYTTLASSYPGKLDTSQIAVPTIDVNENDNGDVVSRKLAKFNADMAEYNKQVADVTNAYNSEVTKWVGESTASIQPENIAQKLYEQLGAATGQHVHIARQGTYVYFSSGAGIRSGSVEDGGDDTYMRSVIESVDTPEKLTPSHYVGKIVRISAKKQTNKDAYYVMAHAKSGTGGGFQEVTWKETAGQEAQPKMFFCIAIAVGDTLHVGSNPGELNQMAPVNCPPFKFSTVGDSISVPLPAFFGKQIDYLGVFQDRLLVGTGATIFASRPGDYFNWFRTSVLTVEDNDPVEMFALGSEDDTIHWDTSFDRNHVLFGRKFQYIIPGRTLMSPKNPSIQVMSANEDAVEARPENSGNFVFYAKDTAKKGSLHQIQMGATSDSSESYECSQQLDKYMRGKPCQILCNTAPFVVMVRSRNYHNGLYIYSYLDSMTGSERLFDSWSRWEWNEKLGPSCGMAKWRGDIIVFTMRNSDQGLWLVADRFTFDTEIADVPYTDSWRPYNVAAAYPNWWSSALDPYLSMAYRNTHEYFLLGSKWQMADVNMPWWRNDTVHLTLGVDFDAYFVPTSPYLRDQNEKAIINGRLTLSNLAIAVDETGGMNADVETEDRVTNMQKFDGRLLTRTQNMVGRAPIVTSVIKVPVYKEIREFKLILSANTWLPLTVTGMEWMGQWFSNVRRV